MVLAACTLPDVCQKLFLLQKKLCCYGVGGVIIVCLPLLFGVVASSEGFEDAVFVSGPIAIHSFILLQ